MAAQRVDRNAAIETEHEAARQAYNAFADPITELEQQYVERLAHIPTA